MGHVSDAESGYEGSHSQWQVERISGESHVLLRGGRVGRNLSANIVLPSVTAGVFVCGLSNKAVITQW